MLSIALAPVTGAIVYFTRRVLTSWGVLDPYADQLGALLKMSSDLILDIGMAVLGLALYIFALWWVWANGNRAAVPAASIPLMAQKPDEQVANASSDDEWRYMMPIGAAALLMLFVSSYFASASHRLSQYKPVDREGVPVERGYAECEYDALHAAANGPHSFSADVATDRLILACMKRRGY